MTNRPTTLCPGTRICCPSCGHPLPYADIRTGDGFFLCQHRKCREHFYTYCTDRLCTTFALTHDERHRFDDGHYSPEEILAAIGQRLMEAA